MMPIATTMESDLRFVHQDALCALLPDGTALAST